jgi:hypothetical protein
MMTCRTSSSSNQKLAHSFSYYDLETGKELHRITFPDFPHEFAVDSESRYAYVGHYGIETHMPRMRVETRSLSSAFLKPNMCGPRASGHFAACTAWSWTSRIGCMR